MKPVDDLSEHEWKIYALDKATGKIVWERIAFSGAPKIKRHTKATQANSTPATDGRRVVAAFGSIGLLVAWDMDGKELWRADLGVLDSGWFFDPSFQWGHSSSPMIHGNSVILQADMQKGSYIAAWDLEYRETDLEDGSRGRNPHMGHAGDRARAVRTQRARHERHQVRGYDPATGKLLWTLGPNSEITVGTPVTGHGLVFVTGGYPPVRPIYAIRPGATGDISLPKGSESIRRHRVEQHDRRHLYPDAGRIRGPSVHAEQQRRCERFTARTGQRAFRGRIGEGGAFSASPVAADGRLYVASEDGEVHVVTADPG